MSNRRVQRILPLMVLVGIAMPVQADLTVEPADPADCSALACLEMGGSPVVIVADGMTSAAMSLYEACPAALQEALDSGAFDDGEAVIQGCSEQGMRFLMSEHSSGALLLTPHERLMMPSSSVTSNNSNSPSCIDLMWPHLIPGDTVPSVMSVVDSVVIVYTSCPELEFVFWLLKGSSELELQLLGLVSVSS